MKDIYTSGPIKRAHRGKAEMDVIREAMLNIVNAGDGMTVRHLFYRLVAADAVEKKEAEYDGTVVRLALELRRDGSIPHGKIMDGSRLYLAPTIYSRVEDAIRATAQFYRRGYWRDADQTVEVWCEKDAIRALIEDVTWDLAVPLMVTRGFASESIVQDLAHDTMRSGKPKVILSLNDHDPSGALMMENILAPARHYAPDATFIAEQVALTSDQVDEYDLPTRPTKREGNSHAVRFQDDRSVELDAMDPDTLRDLLRDAITAHMDLHRLSLLEITEASERRTLLEMAKGGPA